MDIMIICRMRVLRVLPLNYKDQIEYSELRVSLFNVPLQEMRLQVQTTLQLLLLLLVELVIQVLGHILTEQTKICLPGNN